MRGVGVENTFTATRTCVESSRAPGSLDGGKGVTGPAGYTFNTVRSERKKQTDSTTTILTVSSL